LLLDVKLVLASRWTTHSHHLAAKAWIESAAQERMRPGSDVDIAVLFPKPITPNEVFNVQIELVESLSCDVLIDSPLPARSCEKK